MLTLSYRTLGIYLLVMDRFFMHRNGVMNVSPSELMHTGLYQIFSGNLFLFAFTLRQMGLIVSVKWEQFDSRAAPSGSIQLNTTGQAR